MPGWMLYILECADGTYYTGITTNLESRIAAHTSGNGAKYTRGRAPLKLLHTEVFENRSLASKREAEIKALNKTAKLKLLDIQAVKMLS